MALADTLKPSQRVAFDRIVQFMSNPLERFFRLAGYAGTGKTYLLGCVAEHFSNLAQAGTAPTNKATKVFSKKLPIYGSTCKTIYSFLGIKMEADEDRLILKFPQKPADLNKWDLVYVDEGSMLQENMVEYIEHLSDLYPHIKWILSADRAQLNPVGERESKIWMLDVAEVEMVDVVRYDSQILNLATHIRNQIIAFPNWDLRIRSDHKNKEGVWRKKQKDFLGLLEIAAKQNLFHEVDHTKAIAWRNATVGQLNDLIRFHTYGRHAYRERWITGDRIMIASPVTVEGRIRANIDDEGTITKVSVTHNTHYKDLMCYNIIVKMDEGGTLELTLIHENSENDLAVKLNELAEIAKKDRRQWKYFWMLKETFHKIRYSLAITSHRSQGSTYRNCFVDMQDILTNRDKLEALRSLYVASTRPTTSVILS